jgi:hypothetical protein
MSILEFKSNFLGGGARANQFKVELTFPGFVSGGTDAGRKAQFLCHGASLPGSHLGIAPVMYRGREVKLPGERTFTNWQISVLNDTDFGIRNAFESWSNTINNVKNNTGITNPMAVTTNMSVHQLDRNGVILKSYTIADCWPVSVGDINLQFSENDRIEEFTVEIAYSFWETTNAPTGISASVGINTPIGGIGVSI